VCPTIITDLDTGETRVIWTRRNRARLREVLAFPSSVRLRALPTFRPTEESGRAMETATMAVRMRSGPTTKERLDGLLPSLVDRLAEITTTPSKVVVLALVATPDGALLSRFAGRGFSKGDALKLLFLAFEDIVDSSDVHR